MKEPARFYKGTDWQIEANDTPRTNAARNKSTRALVEEACAMERALNEERAYCKEVKRMKAVVEAELAEYRART